MAAPSSRNKNGWWKWNGWCITAGVQWVRQQRWKQLLQLLVASQPAALPSCSKRKPQEARHTASSSGGGSSASASSSGGKAGHARRPPVSSGGCRVTTRGAVELDRCRVDTPRMVGGPGGLCTARERRNAFISACERPSGEPPHAACCSQQLQVGVLEQAAPALGASPAQHSRLPAAATPAQHSRLPAAATPAHRSGMPGGGGMMPTRCWGGGGDALRQRAVGWHSNVEHDL